MGLDHEIRKMATDLQDTLLLARISGGDLEGKYHYKCLSDYKNRHRSHMRASYDCSSKVEDRHLLGRAFAELVCYNECSVENGTYIFKLSQLHCLYESRLSNLGKDTSINKTRLKKQLLDHFSYQCQEQSDGKLLRETADSRDFEAEAL